MLVNGGRREPLPGTWSASLELLVRRLAPRFRRLAFLEVRYRVRSWRRLELCVEDATAALDAAAERGARATLLVGFSMGGAVAAAAAVHPTVRAVVGLAPWLPDALPLDALAGKRFSVVHGSLDRPLPGLAGVAPTASRRGFDRARAAGTVDAQYTLLRGAFHALALRGPAGLVPLPRARAWTERVARELALFEAAAA